jgi:hypothetical protein
MIHIQEDHELVSHLGHSCTALGAQSETSGSAENFSQIRETKFATGPHLSHPVPPTSGRPSG